jgi:nicotinate dehydrogenase subunit A
MSAIRALDPHDERHRERIELGEQLGQGARVGEVLIERVIGHRAHPSKISSGTKGVALASQDDTPRVSGHRLNGRRKLCDQRGVERVLGVRPGERDPRDLSLVDRQAYQFGHRPLTIALRPVKYRLHVNGAACDIDVPRGTTLLEALRDDLGLTATRYGCGRGQCGACYVLADGRAVASCLMSVEQASAHRIVTVEGLATGGELHPVQRAFVEEDAMQCGYCTSGMLISAVALLDGQPTPTENEVRDALAPNLCRCGVQLRAIRAVRRAAGVAP